MLKKDAPFLLLAPMEGVLDPILRGIYSQIGGFDLMTTEFLRVTHHVIPDNTFFSYCPELKNKGKTKEGVPVWVQLLGSDCEFMALNANRAQSLGSLGIDLNFGCPAKTVNRHDGGAVLLKNPERVYKIIQSVKQAVSIPVSAKVRLGYECKTLCAEIAQAVEEAKACHLTIHARTKKEGYKPPAHWEFIAKMKKHVTLPVIANGDIWTYEDYLKCKEVTQCKDVALGRGAIRKPDLALEICHRWRGQSFKNKTWQEIHPWLVQLLDLSFEEKGDLFSVCRLKQWSRLLSPTYPESDEFFQKIKTKKTFEDIKSCVNF